MNDIDFDELDRAVSSLIGKPRADEADRNMDARNPVVSPVSAGTPSAVPERPPALSVPPAKPAGAVLQPTPPISSLPASPSVTPRSAPPAVRRGGRFMDMVQPRRSTSLPQPMKVSPIPQSTDSPYPEKKLELAPKPIKESRPFLSKEPPEPSATHEDEPLLSALAISHPEVKPESKGEQFENHDMSPPLFLSGTKVEKRPLGAFSSFTKNDESPSEKEVIEPDVSAEKLFSVDEKKPVAFGDPGIRTTSTIDLPPELDQHVVAVEAGDIGAIDENDRPDTPPAYPPDLEDKTKKSQPERPIAHQAAISASQSIPAQYKAKHTEPDMTTRPIFDTKQYHQPLAAHATKPKRTSWFWAVLVIVLLAVGAGLGVGAYFLLG